MLMLWSGIRGSELEENSPLYLNLKISRGPWTWRGVSRTL